MIPSAHSAIDTAVNEFFQVLTSWISQGSPSEVPPAIDLLDIRCRKVVLPFAVLATRSNDRHQDIASLIDRTVARIFSQKEEAWKK